MKRKRYLLYNIGDNNMCSHLDALHAQNPKSDQYTGKIVRGVIDKINASGIIATISRTIMDLNRPRNKTNAPAIDEYRDTINEILAQHTGLPVEKIAAETERDRYMTADEAREYGLIDEVLGHEEKDDKKKDK